LNGGGWTFVGKANGEYQLMESGLDPCYSVQMPRSRVYLEI